MSLLEIENLSIEFGAAASPIRAVRNASLSIGRSEIVGIAGESGSGKSTLCAAAIRAMASRARITGKVSYEGRDLYALSQRDLAALHGTDLAMVRQNPMTSLDPLWTIGNQLRETLARRGVPASARAGAAVEALERVRLTAPGLRVNQYPHQLSGGMLQRSLIAMATVASPKILIADEPTSALDASIRDEILVLFRDLRDDRGTSVVIVTHELEVIRRLCDRVIVMYAGEIVEEGKVADVLSRPRHPYTRALIDATPRVVGGDVILTPIPGQVPVPSKLGEGCSFSERCGREMDICRVVHPPRRTFGQQRNALCHLDEAP